MSCDLGIAYERPSAVSMAWRVIQRTYWPIGVVSSTMWRPCSDMIFHRATSQSIRLFRTDRTYGHVCQLKCQLGRLIFNLTL